MGGLLAFVRAELRSRWRSVLGLALLVGLAGTVVLGAAAGARRTASVYDRFAEHTATRDAAVQVDAEDPGPLLEEIESLDIVESSGRLTFVPVAPDPDANSEVELDYVVAMSPDGEWGRSIDRPLVLDGRLPDPTDPTEVLANEIAAEQAGVAVGDRLKLTPFTPAEFEAAFFRNEFGGFSGPTLSVEVVGIGRQGSALEGSDIAAGAEFFGTPALLDLVGDEVGRLDGLLAVRLSDSADFSDLRGAVAGVAGGSEYDVTSSDEDFADGARQAASVFSKALWAFALVAMFASCVAVGGAISRTERAGRRADPVLAALGFDRRSRFFARSALPTIAIAAGGVSAAVGAVVVSPLFPVGITRRMEPDPGVRLDALVVCGGGVLLGIACLAWASVSANRGSGTRAAATRRGPTGVRLALPPVMAIGIVHAFSRTSGGRGVPVRAATLAAVIGVMGVIGSATVVRSVDALADDTTRYGWTWSSEPDVGEEDFERVTETIGEEDGIAAVGVRKNRRVEIDGLVTGGMSFESVSGDIEPVIESGRAPVADHEVALGLDTAEALEASIGDEVTALAADGTGRSQLEVVGIAITAPVESNNAGVGAVLSPSALDELQRSGGYDSVLLRYEEGVDVGALEQRLAETYPISYSVYSDIDVPGWLQNLQRTVPIVVALAVFFVGLGLSGVAHALVIGAYRRRNEFATLRALGLRRRDVRNSVRWGALATIGAGLVVGIPLGIASGRAAWQVIIAGQAVLDAPTLPFLVLLLVAPVGALLVMALSWWPANLATRDLVTDLRSE